MEKIVTLITIPGCKIWKRGKNFFAVIDVKYEKYIKNVGKCRVVVNGLAIPTKSRILYDNSSKKYVIKLPALHDELWEKLWRDGKTVDIVIETSIQVL